jgi:hypothetical protein
MKIIFDNGTEFDVGEKVEVLCLDNIWRVETVTPLYTPVVDEVSITWIIDNPYRVRKIATKVKRKVPRTMREIDDIINVKRYEWRGQGFVDGAYAIGGDVVFNPHNNDCISVDAQHVDKSFFRVNECSPWQPLAEKEVEV